MRISDWSSDVCSSDLKAVAYDTWLYATRAMPRWMSWSLRVLAMLSAAMRLHWVVFRNIRDLLRQDGCNNRATWPRLLSWPHNYPGPLRLLPRASLSYLRPRFPPSQHADRAFARPPLAPPAPPPTQLG